MKFELYTDLGISQHSERFATHLERPEVKIGNAFGDAAFEGGAAICVVFNHAHCQEFIRRERNYGIRRSWSTCGRRTRPF
jgi:hypothetical protein